MRQAVKAKLDPIITKFAGTIMIAHAWGETDGRHPIVCVTFTETAREFAETTLPGAMFYISCEFTTRASDVIPVKLVLRDYTLLTSIPKKGNPAKIRKRFAEPPPDNVFVTT